MAWSGPGEPPTWRYLIVYEVTKHGGTQWQPRTVFGKYPIKAWLHYTRGAEQAPYLFRNVELFERRGDSFVKVDHMEPPE